MTKAKRIKRRIKEELTYTEKLIVKLKDLPKKGGVTQDQIEKADSLVRWYIANHYLTKAQVKLAKSLVAKTVVKSAAKKKHYLYAISDGVNIKLGMSNSPRTRLKGLQTSNSSELVILWEYYVSNTQKGAATAERKLHRACKKFRIRGEWFKIECMDIVKGFNPNRQFSKNNLNRT